MIPQRMMLRSGVRRLQASLLALLIAAPAIAQVAQKEAAPPANAPEANPQAAKDNAAIADASQQPAAPAGKDEPLKLSPFTVTTNRNQGYFAANTLAGSRLNTNLADLGAAISVITKQQMDDTSSVDVNDVFRYEINTEGSGTYTPAQGSFRNDGTLDVNAGGTLGSSVTPFTNSTANRIRGIGVPSAAINYYPAIGQIPLDSYNISSVEISRGPNSMLFGMGSPAGIVNQSTAQAALNKSTNTAALRFDQYGSYRGSFAFNRGIIDDKLAIYGAILYDDRRFDREPAYDLTRRQYGAFTFKPFSKTTIRGMVEHYENDNRRPNTLTPRDFVTQWNLAGQPYYDALNRNIYKNNTTLLGNYVINSASQYAQQARDTVRSLPGYNPALRGTPVGGGAVTDNNFSTYNGIGIFGDAAMTNSSGFIANQRASNNILFVPGLTWVNQPRTFMQIQDGQAQSWFQPLFGTTQVTSWPAGGAASPTVPVQNAAFWASPQADIFNRSFSQSAGWTGIGNNIVGYRYPGVTDKSIYDWRNININAMNWGQDENVNYNFEIEQQILDNLYFTGGWFRQDFDSKTNYTVAQLNVATLFVDSNKYRPDGSANPYFGKPYLMDTDPDQYVTGQTDDHYRAMLAYTPDFTQKSGALKWLGHHQILGLWSRDESIRTTWRNRLQYIDSSTQAGKFRYMANQNPNTSGQPTGWNFQTTSLNRAFYLAAPSDPNGVVTRSSGEWNPIQYQGDIRVYDYTTSQFSSVNMTTKFTPFEAGTGKTYREVDSWSAGITSYLWEDRLIVTAGMRYDDFRARSTTTGQVFRQELSDGDDTNYLGTVVGKGKPVATGPAMTNPEKWVNGELQMDTIFKRWQRWDELDGKTSTIGGVLRPFQKWNSIEQKAANGSLFWEFVRDFGVSYNQSDNFNAPDAAQTDAFGVPLPKPTGEGKDYGFQFSLLDNKLFARVTWFEATNQNERTDPGTSISRLTINVDQTLFRNWARTIVMINMGKDPTGADPLRPFTVSAAEEPFVQAEAEKIWKLPYAYYDGLSIFATRNAEAKGMEAELNYNPIPNWTMRFTFGKQDTKYSDVLKEFDAWYDVRVPVWQAATAAPYLLPQYQSLAQYTTTAGRAVDLRNFWTSYGYRDEIRLDEPNGNTNANIYFNNVVMTQALAARDLDGRSAPNQRKYRWSLLTNYAFTDGGLKGLSTGGSVRWEDKSVIGYYGRASGFNGTQIDVSDINKPIYDSTNTYVDLWAAYTMKLFKDKVRMKVQLNVVNVFESGDLKAVGVNLDGSPYAFRIIDPRQFILSTTFDF